VTINIGQLSYSVFAPIADPGMLADNEVVHIESRVAAEAINPGRLLQIAADNKSVQQVQGTRADTTTATPSYGFSLLLTAREGVGNANSGGTGGGVYNPGDMVPVLKRGALYAEWKGTTQQVGNSALVNVYQSSTIATDRGKITDAAASQGAGTEIGPAGNRIMARQWGLANTGNVIMIDVNYPGAP
jgi:hypothetical protein